MLRESLLSAYLSIRDVWTYRGARQAIVHGFHQSTCVGLVLMMVAIVVGMLAAPSAGARDPVSRPERPTEMPIHAIESLSPSPSSSKLLSAGMRAAWFAMVPIVLRQATPTLTPTPSPTPEPLWITPGGWTGPHIDLIVSADGHYLERAVAYTPCGWVSWHGRQTIGSDGSFSVTATGGAIEGTFVGASRCEGLTDGWGMVGDAWCREQVMWVATPQS
jgi:hypothetical protein